MSRVLLNREGFWIAKEGFSAETAAEKDMLFSANGLANRIKAKGTISASVGVVQNLNPPVSGWNNRYRKITIPISPALDEAPIAMCGGITSAGEFLVSHWAIASSAVGASRFEPYIFTISWTDRLEIMTLYTPAELPTYAYLILENPI